MTFERERERIFATERFCAVREEALLLSGHFLKVDGAGRERPHRADQIRRVATGFAKYRTKLPLARPASSGSCPRPMS